MSITCSSKTKKGGKYFFGRFPCGKRHGFDVVKVTLKYVPLLVKITTSLSINYILLSLCYDNILYGIFLVLKNLKYFIMGGHVRG